MPGLVHHLTGLHGPQQIRPKEIEISLASLIIEVSSRAKLSTERDRQQAVVTSSACDT